MNEVILAFVTYANGHYAAMAGGKVSSETEGIKDACKVVSGLFGRVPAVEFGPKALKLVRAAMTGKGWSRGYANKQVNRVKRMFRWAVAEEMVPASVIHALSAVPAIRRGEPGVRETARVVPVPEPVLAAVLPLLSPTVRAMVDLQRLTGCRPGEVLIMRAGDIDRGGRVWVYRPDRHKNGHRGHSREVFLGPRAQAVVTPWLRADPAAYLFSPADAEGERRRAMRAARKSKVQPSQRDRSKGRPAKVPGDHYTVYSYGRPSPTRARRRGFRPGLRTGCGTTRPRRCGGSSGSSWPGSSWGTRRRSPRRSTRRRTGSRPSTPSARSADGPKCGYRGRSACRDGRAAIPAGAADPPQ